MARQHSPFIHRVPWIIMSVLSLVALIVGIHLYRIQREFTGFASCHIAPGFDCAPALKSRYGRLLGIPLSSFAVANYLLYFVVSLQSILRRRVAGRNAIVMVFLSGVGTLYCAWLVFVSITKLRAYCPFCLMLHVLTPLIFLASLWALHYRKYPIKVIINHELDSIRADRRIVIGIGLAVFLILIGLPTSNWLMRYQILEAHPAYRQILEGTLPRIPELNQMLKDRPYLGKSTALVTIVEFADFTCPVCMQGRSAVDDLMGVYDIKFIYVANPHSRDCNPEAEFVRPGSCLSALVAKYAERHGRFWPTYSALFAQPLLLTEERQDKLAHLAGAPDMATILADSASHAALQGDLALGHQVGVHNVPSFFINGMGVEGLPDDWFLIEAVEREADRVRAAAAANVATRSR